MRVLSVCRFLPDPTSPAAGGFVLSRLAAMAEQARVTILQPVPHFPVVRPLPAWARCDAHEAMGQHIEHAPMFYFPGILKSLDGTWLERSVLGALRRLGGASAFDVVDAHFGYPDGVGCVRAATRVGLPAFVTIRGLEVDLFEKPRMRAQLVESLNRATGVVSVSYSLRDVAVRHGVGADRIRVIPNAVDRERFRPVGRTEARVALGLPADQRIVVAVGNLIELKRHHVLVESFARLREHVPDARLVIIGGAEAEPAYGERLQRMIAAAGLGDGVRLAGRLEPAQVARWLQAADVFALATSREGCCNSILEALACGLPVVTTPAGDNAQFVHDGENGYLVPIDDPAATAAALEAALARRDWDAARISAGLQVGSWPQVARDVLGYFQERLDA